jgi:hypothetical protein
MTIKVRITRFAFPGSSHAPTATALAVAPTPGRTGSTFHAALTDSAEEWVMRGSPRAVFTPRPEPKLEPREQRRPIQPTLARAWAWIRAKYAQTATKRLRVAETVSLGEKRFVSIVIVEGREFLIGGGSSGVTLLAQLGSESESAMTGLKNVRGDAA